MQAIDADGHIVEKDKDIRSRLPEPYSKRTGGLMPGTGLDTNLGGQLGGLENNDIPTRLRDMDREGIETSVLFPTSSFALTKLIERDFAVAYARAYNDFIADVCRESPRLKGIGLVAFQDVKAAVQETNRAITKLGLAGIAVASQNMKEHLGSETFWPIYEETSGSMCRFVFTTGAKARRAMSVSIVFSTCIRSAVPWRPSFNLSV